MTKQDIEIQDFEDKKSQTGKRYTRFKTSNGWMSCWNIEAANKLKDNEGKIVSVEIEEDNDKGFKNITKFYDVVGMNGDAFIPVKKEYNGKDTTTRYVSYAKDLFIALTSDVEQNKKEGWKTSDVMLECIGLIKQAKEAFENGKPDTNNKSE